MKPFSIVCKSCASRLKVSKASAVNQLLACPKCGTMIRVTPPAGWEPTEPIRNSASFESSSQVDVPAPSSSDPFGADFDDIEQILAKPQQPGKSKQPTSQATQPSAQQTQKRKKRKTPTGDRAAATPTPVTSEIATRRPARAPIANEQRDSNSSEEPMLPNDDWQSDETKKRKKFASTLVLLFGSILLLGGIAAAVLMNLPKTDPVVAKNKNDNANNKGGDEKKVVDVKNDDQEASPLQGVGKPNEVDEEVDPVGQQPFNGGVEPRVAGPRNANRAAGNQDGVQRVDFNVGEGDGAEIPMDNFPPGALEAPVGVRPEGPGAVGVGIEGNANQPNAQAPNAIGGENNPRPALPPIGIPQAGKDDPDPGQFPKPKIPGGISPLQVPPLPDLEGINPRLPLRGGNQPGNLNIEPEPKIKAGVGSLEKIDGKIGDLAGLLEENGTSLSQLRDVAEGLSADAPAGIPKYVVEKPDEIKPNLDRLEREVAGMLYDKAPLPRILRDLNSMTGIPITIDARAIANAGKNPNEMISVKIESVTLDTALNKVLVPLGLSHQTDQLGLTISVTTSSELATKKFPLPDSLKSLSNQAKQKILSHIQNMIHPESWVKDQNPSVIKIESDNIVATCPTNCHPKIQSLLDKLDASIVLSKNGSDRAATETAQTRSAAITPNLEKAVEIRHSIQTPIGAYLNKLQKKTGISIVVDWKNVIHEGWNPKTKIPGNIDEPTVREVIRQLAQAMKLTVVVVNKDTLLLTTRSQAGLLVDIEVYPVGKLLDGKFNENTLYETFETTLGSSLRTSRYVFDPNCRCFIVAGSQDKQRQVETLLKRLEGI